MRLDIHIRMDNAAFTDAPELEVARILREYADKLEKGLDFNRMLPDANGNNVGNARVIGK